MKSIILVFLFAISASAAFAFGEDFTVRCSKEEGHKRARLLNIAQNDLRTYLSLDFPAPITPVPMEIELGFPRADGTTNARHWVLHSPQGAWGFLSIPDPENTSAADFRFELAAMIFRLAVHGRAPNGVTPEEPPRWFVAGLARYIERNRRADDFEKAFDYWSHGKLDGAPALWSSNSVAAAASAEVASQLVAWMKERNEEIPAALVKHLAEGKKWNDFWTQEDFDRDLDLWFSIRPKRRIWVNKLFEKRRAEEAAERRGEKP